MNETIQSTLNQHKRSNKPTGLLETSGPFSLKSQHADVFTLFVEYILKQKHFVTISNYK